MLLMWTLFHAHKAIWPERILLCLLKSYKYFIQDRLLSRVHSKKLYLGCFSFQTLFNLGRRLESVCDATDEANGDEENKESGKTAEDDARWIGVLAPLSQNHCKRVTSSIFSLWGTAQCYVGALPTCSLQSESGQRQCNSSSPGCMQIMILIIKLLGLLTLCSE